MACFSWSKTEQQLISRQTTPFVEKQREDSSIPGRTGGSGHLFSLFVWSTGRLAAASILMARRGTIGVEKHLVDVRVKYV
jgi:hypothetical protein